MCVCLQQSLNAVMGINSCTGPPMVISRGCTGGHLCCTALPLPRWENTLCLYWEAFSGFLLQKWWQKMWLSFTNCSSATALDLPLCGGGLQRLWCGGCPWLVQAWLGWLLSNAGRDAWKKGKCKRLSAKPLVSNYPHPNLLWATTPSNGACRRSWKEKLCFQQNLNLPPIFQRVTSCTYHNYVYSLEGS